MNANPLLELKALGQHIWLDNLIFLLAGLGINVDAVGEIQQVDGV